MPKSLKIYYIYDSKLFNSGRDLQPFFLELTAFYGHRIVRQEGVPNLQTARLQAAIPAVISSANGELVQAGRNLNELAREYGCHLTSILSWALTQSWTGALKFNLNIDWGYIASLNPQGDESGLGCYGKRLFNSSPHYP